MPFFRRKYYRSQTLNMKNLLPFVSFTFHQISFWNELKGLLVTIGLALIDRWGHVKVIGHIIVGKACSHFHLLWNGQSHGPERVFRLKVRRSHRYWASLDVFFIYHVVKGATDIVVFSEINQADINKNSTWDIFSLSPMQSP